MRVDQQAVRDFLGAQYVADLASVEVADRKAHEGRRDDPARQAFRASLGLLPRWSRSWRRCAPGRHSARSLRRERR